MKVNIIKISVVSFFLLGNAFAETAPPAVDSLATDIPAAATSATPPSTISIPTIEELKDPTTSYGLDLEKVDKRQKALRKQGDATDISTKIMLFRAQKTLLKKLVGENIALSNKIEELQRNKPKSPRPSVRKKFKKALLSLREEKSALESRITGYRLVQKEQGKIIMKELKLTPTQLARIPIK